MLERVKDEAKRIKLLNKYLRMTTHTHENKLY